MLTDSQVITTYLTTGSTKRFDEVANLPNNANNNQAAVLPGRQLFHNYTGRTTNAQSDSRSTRCSGVGDRGGIFDPVSTKRPWQEPAREPELPRPRWERRRHEPSGLLRIDWTTLMLKFVALVLAGCLLILTGWFAWQVRHSDLTNRYTEDANETR